MRFFAKLSLRVKTFLGNNSLLRVRNRIRRIEIYKKNWCYQSDESKCGHEMKCQVCHFLLSLIAISENFGQILIHLYNIPKLMERIIADRRQG